MFTTIRGKIHGVYNDVEINKHFPLSEEIQFLVLRGLSKPPWCNAHVYMRTLYFTRFPQAIHWRDKSANVLWYSMDPGAVGWLFHQNDNATVAFAV